MLVENRDFFIPPAFDAAVGCPYRNIAIRFGTEKLEWRVYPTVKKFENVYSFQHNNTNVTDSRTDGRTDTAQQHRPRLCTASRGNERHPNDSFRKDLKPFATITFFFILHFVTNKPAY